MDLASIIGVALSMGLVLLAIMWNGVSAIINFYDFQSVLITFGGSFCVVLASNTMSGFIEGLKSFGLILKAPVINTPEMIQKNY